MSREDPQMKIRLPVALKENIEKAAKANKRSMNAEIIDGLESSFVDPSSEEAINVLVALFRKMILAHSENVDKNSSLSDSKNYQYKILRYTDYISRLQRNFQIVHNRFQDLIKIKNALQNEDGGINEKVIFDKFVTYFSLMSEDQKEQFIELSKNDPLLQDIFEQLTKKTGSEATSDLKKN